MNFHDNDIVLNFFFFCHFIGTRLSKNRWLALCLATKRLKRVIDKFLFEKSKLSL